MTDRHRSSFRRTSRLGREHYLLRPQLNLQDHFAVRPLLANKISFSVSGSLTPITRAICMSTHEFHDGDRLWPGELEGGLIDLHRQ